MKLSELVYKTVKNTIFYDDTSFNYNEFKYGNHDGDIDYANNINNCFSCINEAIARLSDLNRIPYFVCEKTTDDKGALILNGVQKQIYGDRENIYVKEIVSVANENFVPVPFSTISGTIAIVNCKKQNTKYFVEFKEDIKHFDRSDYSYEKGVFSGEDLSSVDIELRDYNINDSMCNYIMEYAMGRLLEQVEPNLANMHITRAEQYFSNINPVKSAFMQKAVKNNYRIGD